MNEKELLKKVGKQIFNLRKMKNITIIELSNKTGIRKEYLLKIEQGNALNVRISHLIQITKIVGITFLDFITMVEN